MSTIGRHASKLSDYAPALPTPFDSQGDIDFCGKSQHGVRKLIARLRAFICDESLELCMDIVREENKSSLVKSRNGIPTPGTALHVCRWRQGGLNGGHADQIGPLLAQVVPGCDLHRSGEPAVMAKRERFVTPVTCPECALNGSVIWEEREHGDLETITKSLSDGFRIDDGGEIYCANCGVKAMVGKSLSRSDMQ